MDLDIDLQITGIPDLADRASSLRIPLGQFGETWKNKLTVDQFDKQETADGQPWKALDPDYRSWKSSQGYPTLIGKQTQETFETRTYQLQNDGLTLAYVTQQAAFFTVERPLFNSDPDQLPNGYYSELSRLIENYLVG